jgi:hypothetical protein
MNFHPSCPPWHRPRLPIAFGARPEAFEGEKLVDTRSPWTWREARKSDSVGRKPAHLRRCAADPAA